MGNRESQIGVESCSLLGIGDGDRRVINSEKEPGVIFPTSRNRIARKSQEFKRVLLGITKLESYHPARGQRERFCATAGNRRPPRARTKPVQRRWHIRNDNRKMLKCRTVGSCRD